LRAASAGVGAEARVAISSCESSRDPHSRRCPEGSASLGVTMVADGPLRRCSFLSPAASGLLWRVRASPRPSLNPSRMAVELHNYEAAQP
jgi:hypothetical protein